MHACYKTRWAQNTHLLICLITLQKPLRTKDSPSYMSDYPSKTSEDQRLAFLYVWLPFKNLWRPKTRLLLCLITLQKPLRTKDSPSYMSDYPSKTTEDQRLAFLYVWLPFKNLWGPKTRLLICLITLQKPLRTKDSPTYMSDYPSKTAEDQRLAFLYVWLPFKNLWGPKTHLLICLITLQKPLRTKDSPSYMSDYPSKTAEDQRLAFLYVWLPFKNRWGQKTHLLICLIPLLPGLEDVLRHALKLGVTNLHLPQRYICTVKWGRVVFAFLHKKGDLMLYVAI